MIFNRLMSGGLAVATGLTMAVAGSAAYSNTDIDFENTMTVPGLKLTISDYYDDGNGNITNNLITVSLSTMSAMNIDADYFAFAFDWIEDPNNAHSIADPGLNLADFEILDAKDGEGNDVDVNFPAPPKNDNKDPIPSPDGRAQQTNLCADLVTCSTWDGKGGANLKGGVSGNEAYDYMYVIGSSGESEGRGLFIDQVLFTIDPGFDIDFTKFNPFGNYAVRLQSSGVSGGESIKATFTLVQEPPCVGDDCPNNQVPVPEIDGPVLIQVGFALGGLYLLLLGRRREEDELAHAA